MSNENSATRVSAEASRFLVFTLGQENYGVPLLKVKEVIALTEITPVPHAPAHFKGIMNLRGQVISVIDIRQKFNMAKRENGAETSIVILDLSPLSLGIIVDSIESVVAATPEEIQPPPDLELTTGKDFITGVTRREKRLILLLDIERSLSVEELIAMKSQRTPKAA